MVDILAAAILYAMAFWMGFFLLTYAEITGSIRKGIYPKLPSWLIKLVICPLCVTFWGLAAVSLFVGYTPMMIYCPPMVLFLDLVYKRLIS